MGVLAVAILALCVLLIVLFVANALVDDPFRQMRRIEQQIRKRRKCERINHDGTDGNPANPA